MSDFDPAAGLDNIFGGGTPTSGGGTATPTPTPSPSKRVRQFADGKWYVVDLTTGEPLSDGFRTQAMAVNAAEFTFPYQPPAAPASASGEQGAQAAIALLGRLTGNPNLSLQGQTGQVLTPEGVQGEPQASPAPRTGGSGSAGGSGSSGGSGATAQAGPPSAPDWLSGWVDAFKGLSDKDIIDAYYAGEEGLDRNVVGALLAFRNTDAKGQSKWTEASLNRYLDQIEADKPMGLKKGDIAAMFDPSRADFGARGTFGSSTLGQGIREEGLFTPNSRGSGFVPASDVSGNLFPAAAVVNNQLYTPEHLAEIARMRGMKQGSTMSDLGQSLAEQNRFMELYGADPSRANLATQVASGAYNPANQRIDPASGRPAGEMNELELMRLAGEGVFRAAGGPVRAGQPYIVGEKRPEVFVPEQNGTIVPRVPRQQDNVGEPKERIPRQWEYGDIDQAMGAHGDRLYQAWLAAQVPTRANQATLGRIGTLNPRLAAENPRLYFQQQPHQNRPYPRDRRPEQASAPTSLFEQALMVSMKRQPLMGVA